jgi:hypothetical protein
MSVALREIGQPDPGIDLVKDRVRSKWQTTLLIL